MILGCALVILFLVLVNVLVWPRVSDSVSLHAGVLSILIPARNEESNLPACLDAAIQQGPCVREILVYDDHSTDRTATVVEQYRQQDARVQLMEAVPLPPDWLGKNFACLQLSLASSGLWLLFLDADTRLQPHACEQMLAEAGKRKLTFLSCWPGFLMQGFWEKLLMPMLNFVVFSAFPAPLSLILPNASLGLAHGACMLAEGETYRRIGGHAVVRSEIFEDTRLAQIWREKGERALCLDGQRIVLVRMYGSFREIWYGFQKNFFLAFQHPVNFWIFLLFHAAIFLVPFLLGNWKAAGVVLLTRSLLAIRFHQTPWSVLLHPVAESILLALGISSWWASHTGRGVAWKGRTYTKRT